MNWIRFKINLKRLQFTVYCNIKAILAVIIKLKNRKKSKGLALCIHLYIKPHLIPIIIIICMHVLENKLLFFVFEFQNVFLKMLDNQLVLPKYFNESIIIIKIHLNCYLIFHNYQNSLKQKKFKLIITKLINLKNWTWEVIHIQKF